MLGEWAGGGVGVAACVRALVAPGDAVVLFEPVCDEYRELIGALRPRADVMPAIAKHVPMRGASISVTAAARPVTHCSSCNARSAASHAGGRAASPASQGSDRR